MSGLFGGHAAARIAARMLHDAADDEVVEDYFAMSIRVPESLRAMIDAMASQAGVSRNVMAIDLLKAGIQDVLSQLPDPIRSEIAEEAGGYL